MTPESLRERLDRLDPVIVREAITELPDTQLAALAGLLEDESGLDLPAADYLHDPIGFIERFINFEDSELSPYQNEIIGAIVPRRKVSARGPHGLGKTAMASLIILWFVITRTAAGINWKGMSTSGSWQQLVLYLWPEIHLWAAKIDWEQLRMEPWVRHEQLLDTAIKVNDKVFGASSPDQPAKIEGGHADHIIYILDEAKIISQQLFDAVEGGFSNAGEDTGKEAYAVALSTPGPPIGMFYDIHQRKPGLEDWWVRHVTLEEGIAAGRISRDWAEKRAKQWGVNSSTYKNKVLGEFAAADESSVIPLAWVEAAIERWNKWVADGRPNVGQWVFGCDIAREGEDKTVVASGPGHVIDNFWTEDYTDNTVELGARIHKKIAAKKGRAVVDGDGLGVGTADALRVLGVDTTVFKGGKDNDMKWRDRSGELEAHTRRSAAWWSFRELLDPAFDSQVCLPPNNEMVGDLTGPRLVNDLSGKIRIEEKKQTKKRLGRSPDFGDAVIYRFWRESTAPPGYTAADDWLASAGMAASGEQWDPWA